MEEIATNICAFCGRRAQLRDSHIIPKFVFDWLRDTSGTGYIRFSHTPNKPVQGGITVPLLCDQCEGAFSIWEKRVSEEVFSPLHKNPSQRRLYGKWLAKFSASVAWRVVTFFNQKGDFKHFSPRLSEAKNQALLKWKSFIEDKETNPGVFELHVIPLDGIENARDLDLPPNMTRYFLRSVDIDVACTDKSAFVYAKMCHLLLVGFIEMRGAKYWRGTRVHINRGFVGGKKDYAIPSNFLDYLKGRARTVADALDSISANQSRKITEKYQKNFDRAANSESFRAMTFDVALFGRNAFKKEHNDG